MHNIINLRVQILKIYSTSIFKSIENVANLVTPLVSIKTIDDNPRWLTVKCEEVWVEGEE